MTEIPDALMWICPWCLGNRFCRVTFVSLAGLLQALDGGTTEGVMTRICAECGGTGMPVVTMN